MEDVEMSPLQRLPESPQKGSRATEGNGRVNNSSAEGLYPIVMPARLTERAVESPLVTWPHPMTLLEHPYQPRFHRATVEIFNDVENLHERADVRVRSAHLIFRDEPLLRFRDVVHADLAGGIDR